jgi:hypothetical protein
VLPFIKKTTPPAPPPLKNKKRKAKRKKRLRPVKQRAQERKGEKKRRYTWCFLFIPFETSTVFYLLQFFSFALIFFENAIKIRIELLMEIL